MRNKRILITGAHGFLGKHLVENLRSHGYRHLICPSHKEADLTLQREIQRLFRRTRPQGVIHLAAKVGGIGANQRYPGSFFYENLMMGLELMEQARRSKVEKFVALGTVCSYPKFTPIPFRESDLWSGYPEETNAPYGLAKKMLLVQAQAYRAQYGFLAIHLIPVNLYGPGDKFDPETSHVIPALIRKCIEARRAQAKEITVWGDGTASREFLYVGDCAEAIRLALERYHKSDPINIGSGREIRIRDLVKKIQRFTGFKGRIAWDPSKPNGQPRRRLDTRRARREFGFKASTSLETGLKKTIRWFEEEIKKENPSWKA